jgi:hypothetical protein
MMSAGLPTAVMARLGLSGNFDFRVEILVSELYFFLRGGRNYGDGVLFRLQQGDPQH